MPVIQVNYAIQGFIRPFVVFHQHPHKSKIHEKFRATSRDTFSSALYRVFANIGLFFEVNKTEWVVFKY